MSIDQMYPDMMIDHTQFAKYVKADVEATYEFYKKKEEENEMENKYDIVWTGVNVDIEKMSTVCRSEIPETEITVTMTGTPKNPLAYYMGGSRERLTSRLVQLLNSEAKSPKIKNVIFNNPATIIIWSDGTKTVVKCQKGDTYDKEKGFAMAYLKKLLGNDNTFNKEIHKWVKED